MTNRVEVVELSSGNFDLQRRVIFFTGKINKTDGDTDIQRLFTGILKLLTADHKLREESKI